MEKKQWGLVLSGGGGKGSYQIGAWRALCELGWDTQITGISGTSVGALNLALMVCTNEVRAERIWRAVTPLDFLDIDLPLESDGIFSREGLVRIIRENVDLGRVSAYPYPLFAGTSMDAGNGRYIARYFRLNGEDPERILSLLLASSAMPVAYPSVTIDGARHSDGGITNNVPVKPLYNEGFRNLLVIDVAEEDQLIPALYPEAELVHIRPSRDIGHLLDGTLDFSAKGAEFRLELGYRDTLRVLTAYEKGEWGKPEFAAAAAIDAEADYQQIRVDMMQKKYTDTVYGRMNKLDDILKKYNIDPEE